MYMDPTRTRARVPRQSPSPASTRARARAAAGATRAPPPLAPRRRFVATTALTTRQLVLQTWCGT
jgi:hypothetical protein